MDTTTLKSADYLIDIYRQKLRRFSKQKPNEFPHYSIDGQWNSTTYARWTAGFWVGQHWWLWHITGNSMFRSSAERYQDLMHLQPDKQLYESDMGMLYFHSFALAFELTEMESFQTIALAVADRLLSLQAAAAGLIVHEMSKPESQTQSNQTSTIIDVMMNLRLLWWAYERTGSSVYLEVAQQHAHRSLEWLVREDGSTIQVVDYDAHTGQPIGYRTHQGLNPMSCWSRGQAWAIYGFLLAFHHTGEQAFLSCVNKLLLYWRDHIASDFIPYWDFLAPIETRYVRDTSAAAIVCAALTQARIVDIPIEGIDAAELLQKTLSSLADGYLQPSSADGVLSHGCLHFPAGRGINEALVVGDYFLLEALANLKA